MRGLWKDSDWAMRAALMVLIAGMVFSPFGAYMGYKQRAEFRHLCEAAGGVPMQPKGQWACLRRDQFVRLP